MYHPKHRVPRGVLSLCALAFLVACDDDPGAPAAEEPFRPVAAAEAVHAIQGVLAADRLEDHLGLISFTLDQAAGDAASPGRPAFATIPADYAGRTLVYDAETGRYIVDPSRSGAPAHGTRFVTYALGSGNAPVAPLEESGYIDLTMVDEDESSVTVETLYRSTTAPATTLARYTTEVSMVESAGGTRIGVDAAGWIADRTAEKVDFEVELVFVLPAGGAVGEFLQRIEFTSSSGMAFVHALSSALDPATFSHVGVADLDALVQNGDGTLAFDLAIAQTDALDGTVDVDDVPVLGVAGSFLEPAFLTLDGMTAPAVTRGDMTALWADMRELMGTGLRLVAPAETGL